MDNDNGVNMSNIVELTQEQFEAEIVKEPKVYTQQDFLAMYEEVVKKTGLKIAPNPVWLATNHGTFELSVQLIIVKV